MRPCRRAARCAWWTGHRGNASHHGRSCRNSALVGPQIPAVIPVAGGASSLVTESSLLPTITAWRSATGRVPRRGLPRSATATSRASTRYSCAVRIDLLVASTAANVAVAVPWQALKSATSTRVSVVPRYWWPTEHAALMERLGIPPISYPTRAATIAWISSIFTIEELQAISTSTPSTPTVMRSTLCSTSRGQLSGSTTCRSCSGPSAGGRTHLEFVEHGRACVVSTRTGFLLTCDLRWSDVRPMIDLNATPFAQEILRGCGHAVVRCAGHDRPGALLARPCHERRLDLRRNLTPPPSLLSTGGHWPMAACCACTARTSARWCTASRSIPEHRNNLRLTLSATQRISRGGTPLPNEGLLSERIDG